MTAVPDAIVLLSGGLDSATCLAIARHEGFTCHALSFRYGQRHAHELDCARALAAAAGIGHTVVDIDLASIGGSALTSPDIAVPATLVMLAVVSLAASVSGLGPALLTTADEAPVLLRRPPPAPLRPPPPLR